MTTQDIQTFQSAAVDMHPIHKNTLKIQAYVRQVHATLAEASGYITAKDEADYAIRDFLIHIGLGSVADKWDKCNQ